MKTVTSKDGTTIAFDQFGTGPAIILVTGATAFASQPGGDALAMQLAPHFSAINYDRRGRGKSGDTLPYAVEREIEDIDVLIDAAGGSAFLYGISSGAVLALEAASILPNKVKKLALYEPPFIIDDSRPPLPDDYVAQLNAAIAAGRRGDAFEIFLTKAVGIPAEFVAQMRNAPPMPPQEGAMYEPTWSEMEAVAHTIAYDGTIMGNTMSGKPLPEGKWVSAAMPTLVMTGGNSEAFFHDGAKALVGILPNAQHRILEGQDHAVSPTALAPVLMEFFKA
ncbi:MAG: alpha/beta hydrolase [Anaerolineae bacterium]|nr:alpha/beta hydrolase [Anaerolineae bacterium]MCI0609584.1 alpha/beta hydrolase [Anaerolineae bacterium]